MICQQHMLHPSALCLYNVLFMMLKQVVTEGERWPQKVEGWLVTMPFFCGINSPSNF